MVDLAIAANFVRELTEEQFAEQRRSRRRSAPTGGRPGAAGPATEATGRRAQVAAGRPEPAASGAAAGTNASRAQTAAGRPEPAASRGGRFAATRLGRTLSRLVQVRG
jgi:hypothetical protein